MSMGSILWLGLILLADFVCANKDCGCQTTPPPLQQIFQAVPHFKTTQFCNRTCTSDYHVSDEGVRQISFKCKLNECETASELCGCVYNYISQKKWLDGSTARCCVKKNYVTLKLTGQPDPTFHQPKNDTSNERPLQQLKGILDQFPKAELAKHNCRPTTSIDDCGCVHCKIECDLRPDSPCEKEICADILEYLDQGCWLEKSTSKCTRSGELLHLEIIGDSKPGDACVSKYSHQ